MVLKRVLSGIVAACTIIAMTGTAFAGSTIAYYDVKIKSDKIGNYQFNVESHEIPSHETLPIVDKSYFPSTVASFATEVDNTAPSATYSSSLISKVDVIFAVGESSQTSELVNYIPTFTSSLQASSNHIDANVKQVETSTIDMSEFGAEQIFNSWRKMPVSTGRGDKIWKLDMSEGKIYAEGVRTLENRHTSTGIIDDSQDGFATTDFTMSFTHNTKGPRGENTYRNVYNGWSPHISGAMFRYTEDDIGVWDAYMLVIGDSSTSYSSGTGIPFCAVIKIRNGDADFLPGTYAGSLPVGWSAGVRDKSGALSDMAIDHQGLVYRQGQWCKGERNSKSDMLLMGARSIVNTDSHDFKLEVTGNNIKVYCGDKLQLDLYDTYGEPYMKGTYGLYSYSSPNIYFSNFMISRGSTMSLGEAITDVAWRSEALRFIIHITDVIPEDFKDENSAEYLYTLSKLTDGGTYLINIGVNSNKDALNGMVDKLTTSDGVIKGTFFESNKPNIEIALVKAKDYIISIAKAIAKPTDYILVGDEVIWETDYDDQEHDVPLNLGDNEDDDKIIDSWSIGTELLNKFKEDQILAERWRYRHNNTYYDNDLGRESYHDTWIEEPVSVFNRPGQFRINYKRRDNPFTDDFSLSNAFDNYRYWSYDYDPVTGEVTEEVTSGVLMQNIEIKNKTGLV